MGKSWNPDLSDATVSCLHYYFLWAPKVQLSSHRWDEYRETYHAFYKYSKFRCQKEGILRQKPLLAQSPQQPHLDGTALPVSQLLAVLAWGLVPLRGLPFL